MYIILAGTFNTYSYIREQIEYRNCALETTLHQCSADRISRRESPKVRFFDGSQNSQFSVVARSQLSLTGKVHTA